ncbi:MAG: type IX secretion system membrane protein PorP/SprF [Bacteroidota bacterium]|nr:type IX secretion system membrane protein PorP/SprF [Bacteroidota bacterium]
MLKKIIIILFPILFASVMLKAQQMQHYSQYFLNDFAINPAVAGTEGFFDVRSNHRSQWVGITDSPRTFTLSMNTPIHGKNMGLGGTIFTDITGPTRRIGASFSYSYHLQIAKKTKLAMGLSAGVLQFAIDGSKITVRDPGDNYFSTGVQSTVVPDFGFGLYLYHDNYFFGASAPQITQNRLKFFENVQTKAKLEDHYFVTGGYKFNAGENFQIQPMLMVKYVAPVPIQFDISTRVIYQEKIWLGATYRTKDAVSAMLGFIYQENLMIGYSYDYTISGLQRYSSGTHEIMLGLRFGEGSKPSAPSIN